MVTEVSTSETPEVSTQDGDDNGSSFPVKYRRMLSHWDEQSEKARRDLEERGGEPPKLRFPPQTWKKEEYTTGILTDLWGDRYTSYRETFKNSYRDHRKPYVEGETPTVDLDVPIYIDFDLVDSCNLACPACSENFREWTRKEIDLEKIYNDPIFEDGKVFSVNIGNAAEPYLAPEKTQELISFFRERQVMDIFVHTNAVLFDEEMIDRLIAEPPTWLSVSVDAITPETYELVRGKGFEKMMSNLELLLKKRDEAGSPFPFLRMSFLTLPENYHEMWDFHAFWKERAEVVEFQDYGCTNPVGHFTKSYVAESDLFGISDVEPCSQPFYRLSIAAGNTISPCCNSYGHLDELRLGMLGDAPLLDIFNSQKTKYIRSQHTMEKMAEDLPSCAQCMRQRHYFKYYGKDFRDLEG